MIDTQPICLKHTSCFYAHNTSKRCQCWKLLLRPLENAPLAGVRCPTDRHNKLPSPGVLRRSLVQAVVLSTCPFVFTANTQRKFYWLLSSRRPLHPLLSNNDCCCIVLSLCVFYYRQTWIRTKDHPHAQVMLFRLQTFKLTSTILFFEVDCSFDRSA